MWDHRKVMDSGMMNTLFKHLTPLQCEGLYAHWHTQVVGILWKLSGKLLHICPLELPPQRDFRNIHLPIGYVLHLFLVFNVQVCPCLTHLGHLSLHISKA